MSHQKLNKDYSYFSGVLNCFSLVFSQCFQDKNETLFYGIPWSHGSIGFIVAAELKILPAKPYVRLHYEPVFNLDEMIKKFQDHSENVAENDFVECLAYSKDQAVLMTGRMTDDVELSKVSFIRIPLPCWLFVTHSNSTGKENQL